MVFQVLLTYKHANVAACLQTVHLRYSPNITNKIQVQRYLKLKSSHNTSKISVAPKCTYHLCEGAFHSHHSGPVRWRCKSGLVCTYWFLVNLLAADSVDLHQLAWELFVLNENSTQVWPTDLCLSNLRSFMLKNYIYRASTDLHLHLTGLITHYIHKTTQQVLLAEVICIPGRLTSKHLLISIHLKPHRRILHVQHLFILKHVLCNRILQSV